MAREFWIMPPADYEGDEFLEGAEVYIWGYEPVNSKANCCLNVIEKSAADKLAEAIERFDKASQNPPDNRKSKEGIAWCEEWESARNGLTNAAKEYRGEE